MADIRINALATTATTPASDDYLALDGTAQGTRKILATNIANNVTDVILGTSGPSVKSSLSARAPRQGLVFDGTAGATHSNITLGSGDFTVAVWARLPTTSAANRQLLGSSGGDTALFLDTTGLAKIYISGQTTHTASSVVPDQKSVLIVYTRSGTSGTFYQNAVSNGAVTDSNNYSTAWSYFGARSGGGYTTGTLIPLIYNRALSASEVVALYEAGAPAGADYNTPAAGSTDLKPSSGTYAYWFGTGSISAATATSFTIAAGASSLAVRNTSGTITVKAGTRYRFTVVASGLNSNASLAPQGVSTNATAGNIANGTNTVELTFSGSGSPYFAFSDITSTAGGSISISSIQALGLLLAPDAAQAGGGLVWYDTSGNAANITLPASGVSWNVPFGNNIAASGTNQNITLTPSGTGSVLAHDTNAFYRNTNSGSDTATKLKVKTASNAFLAIDGGAATSGVSFGIYNSSSNPVRQSAVVGIASNTTAGSEAGYLSFFTQTGGSSLTERGRFTETGNYLIGTTTESGGGEKLQVLGSALVNQTSAGASYPLTLKNSMTRAGSGQYVGLRIASSDATSTDLTLLLFGDPTAANRNWRLGAYDNSGGGFIAGQIASSLVTFTGAASISSTTASTSTTTGALVVSGGVGVAGAINMGGSLTVATNNSLITLSHQGGASNKSTIESNAGVSGNYNGMRLASNWTGTAQGNSGFPSWFVDFGGYDGVTYGQDKFFIGRAPAGSTTISQLLQISNAGNATLSGSLTVSGTSSLFGAASYLDTDASTPVLAVTGARSTTAAGVFTNQLNIQDTGTLAAGQGGAINFGGNASGGVYRSWGAISGAKTNATATDYAGGLKFWTRVGGGSMREALHLDTALLATFAGNLAVNGTTATISTGNATLSLGNIASGSRANSALRTDTAGGIDISSGTGGVIALGYDVRTRVDSYVPVKVLENIDSSSTTTGALTVAGGVGIAKKLYVGDNIVGSGSVTTGAPTSGTAKAWKLGEVATVSPTSPNRTIRVEIDGTVYYISAKTTND